MFPDPKERLKGTLKPPTLWTATRHHQEVVVKDLEASQPVDGTSIEAVALHYKRGCWVPSGPGEQWSSLRAPDSNTSNVGKSKENSAWSVG